jgi:hypothetical protein
MSCVVELDTVRHYRRMHEEEKAEARWNAAVNQEKEEIRGSSNAVETALCFWCRDDRITAWEIALFKAANGEFLEMADCIDQAITELAVKRLNKRGIYERS